MSVAKVKSIFPLPPISSSDGESKKSPVMMDKVAMCATRISQSSGSSSNISPVPTPRNIKTIYGQLLTPAPGRLTPTGQGRIKAPPVCIDPALKKVASSISEFNSVGVCFTQGEAERCAEKARGLDGTVNTMVPLNDPGFSWDCATVAGPASFTVLPSSSEGGMAHQFRSSNSTVVTVSSFASSCGRISMGREIASVASVATKKGPPLEVVRMDPVVNSEDELVGGGRGSNSAVQQAAHDVSRNLAVNATATGKGLQPSSALSSGVSRPPEALPTSIPLSSTFTNNLVKGKLSRQGRSHQRWLVSPTDELVRQVAGTVPITRDGRIILVSASRKMEWILPKGGWDEDETKEECAARETFEEAGLLGWLGGSLDPVDYETSKARKRRLSQNNCGGSEAAKERSCGDGTGGEADDSVQGQKREGCGEDLRPHFPKRVKTEATTSMHCTSVDAAKAPATMSFDPSRYSYVRLFLFPLYVSSVKSDWPESGRLRKLVTIDEAIRIMETQNRPYFERGLKMVKERGLHLFMKSDEGPV